MEEVKDIETYGTLINDMRRKGVKFTNNNVLSDDIKRFIELNRIKCYCSDRCLIFFLDEEKYYRLLFHIDPGQPWDLPELDKPALIRTRFVQDKKKADLLKLEGQIREKGFERKDTNVIVTLDSAPIKEACQRKYERSKKILSQWNARIIKADYSYRDQINTLMDEQDMIKYYHVAYKTEDEIKARFEKGDYYAIVNGENEVMLYSSATIDGGIFFGDEMVVKEEYKLCGFAPILFYYGIGYGLDALRKASLSLENDASIALHKRLGWKFTNKYIENWLLE